MERQAQQPAAGPPTPKLRRRRRPALSCRECRRRKIKCDHNNPCGHCQHHKTQCIYRPYSYEENISISRPGAGAQSQSPAENQQSLGDDAASSRATTQSPSVSGRAHPFPSPLPSASTAHQIPPARDPLSVHHHDPRHPPRPAPTAAPTAAPTPAHSQPVPPSLSRPHQFSDSRPSLSDHGPDHGLSPSLRDLLQRVQKLEESSAPRTDDNLTTLHALSEADRNSLAHPSPATQQEWQAVLNKPRDWGRSRWMGAAADEYAAIIACYSEMIGRDSKEPAFQTPEVAALITEAGEYLRKCKVRAKSIKVGRPTRGLPPPGYGLNPPSRDVADAIANLYFASFESTHRILHAPTFWAEYQKFWEQPDAAAPDLRLKVLLVIGIGSSLYDHGDAAATHRNIETVHQWIYAAQMWLSGPLEKDRLNMTGLQIYCLTLLARQIFSIGGDTVWLSVGSLVHRAMQMGLHRDPKHLPAMPLLQAELRRRLWATILELVVQASLDAWMPPRISLDEFDTLPPANVNDDELLSDSATSLTPHPPTTFTSTSIQLALLSSLPTRLRIVHLLNNLHASPSYPSILSLTSQLTSALAPSQALKSATPFHRNLLDYLTRRFLIPLHYAPAHAAHANPLFHYSLKLSLDAALALISPEQPDPLFAQLMATGGGLFREGIRHAASAVGLELLSHVESQRRSGTLGRVMHYREALKGAVGELMRLAEERVRRGETNVKSHMFLGMIMGQVAAVEEGRDVGMAVAKAARDSLEFCYGLLLRLRPEGSGLTPEDAGVDGMIGSGMDAVERLGFDGIGMGGEMYWESFFPDGGF